MGIFGHIQARSGAEIPWISYQAEALETNGFHVSRDAQPHTLGSESSGQEYIRLDAENDYIEFNARAKANSIVLRYSLPDDPDGGGHSTSVELLVNGNMVKSIPLSSARCWLYGNYPFSNNPADGKPRHFYDEARHIGLDIQAGDSVRIRKPRSDGISCSIDLVDLEQVDQPEEKPPTSLSVCDFGAAGDGVTDDTDALRATIEAAAKAAGSIWVPPGRYKLTGDIVIPSGIRLQGAGMWHTVFVGDPELYHQVDRRVRFKLDGKNIEVADFSIIGALDYRNDREMNDGIIGWGCKDTLISRIWIERTKVGAWIYNGQNVCIEGCRFRNLIADGVNLCVGSRNSIVANCTARGTGDDCFAIWPVPSGRDFVDELGQSGNNVIRRCTGEATFLANGASIYGGSGNRIEDCRFTDIGTGSGILISTTFRTDDPERGIDNNFSDHTVISNCLLERCGGYDHGWRWRGALQICMDRRSISGIRVTGLTILDSLSHAVSIVAPGNPTGNGTLSDSRMESVSVHGIGSVYEVGEALYIHDDVSGSITLKDSPTLGLSKIPPGFTILEE